jgi:hypothetical protein
MSIAISKEEVMVQNQKKNLISFRLSLLIFTQKKDIDLDNPNSFVFTQGSADFFLTPPNSFVATSVRIIKDYFENKFVC